MAYLTPGVYTNEIDLSYIYVSVCDCCDRTFFNEEEYVIHTRKSKLNKIKSKI